MHADEGEHQAWNDEDVQVEEVVQRHAIEAITGVHELLQILANKWHADRLPRGNVH